MTDARDAARIAQAITSDLAAIRSGAILSNPNNISDTSHSSSTTIRVFVSWAHVDEDWNEDQSSDWERTVITFTTILRSLGIDADVDLYHGTDSTIDWTRFGQSGVLSADYVIVLNSKGWGERWLGTNTPTLGAGAVVEADTIKGLLQEDQDEFQRKILVVRLPGPGKSKIPTDLNRLNRYNVDTEDVDSFDPLIRTLSGQPVYEVPVLGKVPTLPPAVMRGINMRKRAKTSREFSDYEALREEAAKVTEEEKADSNPDLKQRLSTLMGLIDALQK